MMRDASITKPCTVSEDLAEANVLDQISSEMPLFSVFSKASLSRLVFCMETSQRWRWLTVDN